MNRSDVQNQQAKIFEYALEECIAQFDYSNDEQWRKNFKQMMISHAEKRLKEENK